MSNHDNFCPCCGKPKVPPAVPTGPTITWSPAVTVYTQPKPYWRVDHNSETDTTTYKSL